MEQLELIRKYVDLKKNHQDLFYKYKKLQAECAKLKNKIEKLEKSTSCEVNNNILKENKRLVSKISQLHRISISTPIIKVSTPKNTEKSLIKKNLDTAKKRKSSAPKGKCASEEFEVEKLLNHRGSKGKREFLVRWKGFNSEEDSWQKEQNLSCPKILKQYLEQHRLAH